MVLRARRSYRVLLAEQGFAVVRMPTAKFDAETVPKMASRAPSARSATDRAAAQLRTLSPSADTCRRAHPTGLTVVAPGTASGARGRPASWQWLFRTNDRFNPEADIRPRALLTHSGPRVRPHIATQQSP
jgi:hypothetical protein